jgi:hypothetical protein
VRIVTSQRAGCGEIHNCYFFSVDLLARFQRVLGPAQTDLGPALAQAQAGDGEQDQCRPATAGAEDGPGHERSLIWRIPHSGTPYGECHERRWVCPPPPRGDDRRIPDDEDDAESSQKEGDGEKTAGSGANAGAAAKDPGEEGWSTAGSRRGRRQTSRNTRFELCAPRLVDDVESFRSAGGSKEG